MYFSSRHMHHQQITVLLTASRRADFFFLTFKLKKKVVPKLIGNHYQKHELLLSQLKDT